MKIEKKEDTGRKIRSKHHAEWASKELLN